MLSINCDCGNTRVLKQDFNNVVTGAQMSRTMQQFRTEWVLLLNWKVLQTQNINIKLNSMPNIHGFQTICCSMMQDIILNQQKIWKRIADDWTLCTWIYLMHIWSLNAMLDHAIARFYENIS